MEELLKNFAGDAALAVEAIAIIVIVFGTIDVLVHGAGTLCGWIPRSSTWRKEIFVRFGYWLMFGLLFALAADIIRTVIAPTWNDIGQLAAIAAIRTFLNYFLERDLAEVSVSAR